MGSTFHARGGLSIAHFCVRVYTQGLSTYTTLQQSHKASAYACHPHLPSTLPSCKPHAPTH